MTIVRRHGLCASKPPTRAPCPDRTIHKANPAGFGLKGTIDLFLSTIEQGLVWARKLCRSLIWTSCL